MSIITCQIGQCGNQLGEAVLTKVVQEALGATETHQLSTLDTFFRFSNSKKSKTNLLANSLLIDMEPKVIDRLLSTKKNGWEYDRKLAICKQEGSGNNWAYGFNEHGKESGVEILSKLRGLVESLDSLDGIFFLQSLAGGTGSGVGSQILGLIREEMPDINIFSTAVLPRFSGEVILQFYNSVFSLATLYNECDGIFLFQNDHVSQICKEVYSIKAPDFKDLNFILANQISSFLYPMISPASNSFFARSKSFQPLNDTVNFLLRDPHFKLLGLRYVPQMPEHSKSFSVESWSALEKRIYQMMLGASTEANINWRLNSRSRFCNRSFGNITLTRGVGVKEFKIEHLDDPDSYSRQGTLKVVKDDHKFDKNQRSLTLVSNSGEYLKTLDFISNKAHHMFQSNSYLHHYEKYGLTKDCIIDYLTTFENIIQKYQEA